MHTQNISFVFYHQFEKKQKAFVPVFLWVVIFPEAETVTNYPVSHKTKASALFSIQSKAQFIYKAFSLCVSCRERN